MCWQRNEAKTKLNWGDIDFGNFRLRLANIVKVNKEHIVGEGVKDVVLYGGQPWESESAARAGIA